MRIRHQNIKKLHGRQRPEQVQVTSTSPEQLVSLVYKPVT
ncbi:hypothetical protein ANCCAN_08603 [Ancylostoma caninum]|uniref:Uncharacterized protein n=1 Tax=Ancylostoma caninum TaxID=29170 RepID=A0A368GLX4_ANCCA|nr:hypothetical protein ANCCAN_08603 [Ancylostoma caninum]